MTAERLYKVHEDAPEKVEFTEPHLDEPHPEPEGWAEYCQERWGEHRAFWWPSTKRIYRSRSAAVERAALVNRWGGNAIVLECTPNWRSLDAATRERALGRSHQRIQALRPQLDRERARFDLIADASIGTGQRELKRRTDVDEHLRALDD